MAERSEARQKSNLEKFWRDAPLRAFSFATLNREIEGKLSEI